MNNQQVLKREASGSSAHTTVRSPYTYLVTIKCPSFVYVSIRTLKQKLRELIQKIKGGDWSIPSIELDTHHRLHLHCVAYFKNALYIKKIVKFFQKGWHVHFQKVDNPPATHRYVNKHKGATPHVQQQYQAVSYARYRGFF